MKLDNEKVLIIAEDPVFQIPGQDLEKFGWYAVHIGASDIAVMGVKPQYMTYSLLMPPGTPEKETETIIESVHTAAKDLGISIVGGHTGFYPVVVSSMIGGMTVFSICRNDEYLTPMGAKPGNKVIVTKGPAIEATAVLAELYEKKLLKKASPDLVESAKNFWKQMTVVEDALVAKACGGVTAMHDATEGGVMGGLFELGLASGVGLRVDESELACPAEVSLVCETLGIDPMKAISEGSLILTCEEEQTECIIENLMREGIIASVIGDVVKSTECMGITRADGKKEEIVMPEQDEFFPAVFKALKR